MEKEISCFDCKFYDYNQYVCMYKYACMCILNERKTVQKCENFKEGEYNPNELEESNYE
jgi:hypothetical protein